MVLLPPLAPSSARTLQKKRILQQVIHNISAHNTSKEAKEKSNTDTTNNTTTNMKVIVNGECFAASGLTQTNSEDRPEKCSAWEHQKTIGSCTANAVAGAYEHLCNWRAIVIVVLWKVFLLVSMLGYWYHRHYVIFLFHHRFCG